MVVPAASVIKPQFRKAPRVCKVLAVFCTIRALLLAEEADALASCAWYLELYSPPATAPFVLIAQSLAACCDAVALVALAVADAAAAALAHWPEACWMRADVRE